MPKIVIHNHMPARDSSGGHEIRVLLKNPRGERYTHVGAVAQRNTATENEFRRAVEQHVNADPIHRKSGPWTVFSSAYQS